MKRFSDSLRSVKQLLNPNITKVQNLPVWYKKFPNKFPNQFSTSSVLEKLGVNRESRGPSTWGALQKKFGVGYKRRVKRLKRLFIFGFFASIFVFSAGKATPYALTNMYLKLKEKEE
eukprot:maker-scaffold_2-snap-gene-23.1-mRNA-1 protein AED:0.00 eAED:0.00 QI:30/1/1/1/0.5/0.33/3/326/116